MRYIESYLHQNRVGVLVELEIGGGVSVAVAEVRELASDIALQIAATNPMGIDADLMQNVVPVKFRPNEVSGSETPLLQQTFVKDTSMVVKERIETLSATLKTPIRVVRFERYSIDDT